MKENPQLQKMEEYINNPLQLMEKYISHPNPSIRMLVVESLRAMGMEGLASHSELTDFLQKLMDDEKVDVKIAAVNALLDLADMRRTPPEILISDTKIEMIKDSDLLKPASGKTGKELKTVRRFLPKKGAGKEVRV